MCVCPCARYLPREQLKMFAGGKILQAFKMITTSRSLSRDLLWALKMLNTKHPTIQGTLLSHELPVEKHWPLTKLNLTSVKRFKIYLFGGGGMGRRGYKFKIDCWEVRQGLGRGGREGAMEDACNTVNNNKIDCCGISSHFHVGCSSVRIGFTIIYWDSLDDESHPCTLLGINR